MEIENFESVHNQLAALESSDLPKFERIEGGHFHYLKHIVEIGDTKFFMKTFAPDKFTDPVRREHSRAYLEKEYKVMRYLAGRGYSYLPAYVDWLDNSDTLVEEAFPVNEGWFWELPQPEMQQKVFVQDIVEALDSTPAVDADFEALNSHDSLQEYYDLGWQTLENDENRQAALRRLRVFAAAGRFHPHVQTGVNLLGRMLKKESGLQDFQSASQQHLQEPRPIIAHYDARQSNIAWHPEHGARIVDWSWAAPGPRLGDQTMFTIDLFKSGRDVSSLLSDYFDPDHAAMLIGLWLGRSSAPTRDGNTEVRFHQLASAATAVTLMYKY